MRIVDVRWWRYRIPFRAPFATAHGVLKYREGVLIELTTDTGDCGLGEIAPLPGFGGSVDELWQQLPDVARFLLECRSNEPDGGDSSGKWRERGDARAPAVPVGSWAGSLSQQASEEQCLPGSGAWQWPAALRCGVETALLDIAAQTTGCSLVALFGSPGRATIPVNATVGTADTAGAAERAAAAVAAGFATVKLKVGMEPSTEAEAARVGAVRNAIGADTLLRLDANAAWTVETAISIIERCAGFRLEWVEQPVAATDVAGLAQVRQAVSTPIAADESVTGADSVRALLAAGAADVLVLKPMMLGGPAAALQVAELARAAGVACVVTSTLETGIGLAATAHAAAALPEAWHASGLATAALLEDDLLADSLRIERGRMLLPEGRGLGVQMDWERLQYYTIASGELAAR